MHGYTNSIGSNVYCTYFRTYFLSFPGTSTCIISSTPTSPYGPVAQLWLTLNYLLYIHLAVLTGCGDATARIYAGKSGTLARECKGHEGAINALQVKV